MRLDLILVGMVTFSVFLTVGVFIIGDVSKNYEEFGANLTTDKFANITDMINATYDISVEQKDATLGEDIEGGDETWESMVKGSYKAARQLKDAPGLIGGVLNEIAKQVGVPSIFITLTITVLTITISFGILYLVFKVRAG